MRKALCKLHIHKFECIKNTGEFVYLECKCGKRKIKNIGVGFQSVDYTWLNTGKWTSKDIKPYHAKKAKPL